MDRNLEIMKKRRPSLSDCGVMPLSRRVHQYLLLSYLMWPLLITLGRMTTEPTVTFCVFVSFTVLGFLFYNLLVSMCQMSHDPQKRLRISQWVFGVSFTLLMFKVVWVCFL